MRIQEQEPNEKHHASVIVSHGPDPAHPIFRTLLLGTLDIGFRLPYMRSLVMQNEMYFSPHSRSNVVFRFLLYIH